MITVYHVKFSRSIRVIWTLEELGIDYEVKTLSMMDRDLRKPEFLALNPLGLVPAIIDGDITMCESGAIVQYLLDKYGPADLVPAKDSPAFAYYLQWFHLAEASATVPVGDVVQNTRIKPEPMRIPEQAEWATKKAQKAFAMMEEQLGKTAHIAGDNFTAADIMATYALILGGLVNLADGFPNCLAYLERMKQRPGLQAAMGA